MKFMTAEEFRQEFRLRLSSTKDSVLLRVVAGPGATPPVELTGPEIVHRGEALASRYGTPGSREVILVLLPHSPELFLLHLGLVLTNQLPAILPWPTTRIDPDKYQRNLVHQLRNLPAHRLITLPKLAASLAAELPFPVIPCAIQNAEHFERNLAVPVRLASAERVPSHPPVDLPDDALFLQFSGGTTGAQKAVVVTSSMHEQQLRRLREALDFSEVDGVVSWLPMYHDMGLIACLWFPLWHGAPSLQLSASDWLMNPELLFFYLDRYRGTFCWMPNFAFSYLTNRREDMAGDYSLGHVRGWVNCSEPVRLKSMKHFFDAFGCWGVTMESLQASYAMAENVFAVTQTALERPARTFPRTLMRSSNGSYSQLAFNILDEVYVSSGTVLEGMEVRIVAEDRICAEAQPGMIQIRTSCMFSGYWGADGFSRNSISADGWYSTGDYGFLAEGELYVIGRMKDIVIVGGQNVFPEDVETIVNTLEGIYAGRVVAFGVPDEKLGTEALAVVGEVRGPYDRKIAGELERKMQQLVLSSIGVAPRYVAAVPERWIVKSTAGKISRRETRIRFEKEYVARRVPGPVGTNNVIEHEETNA
jgi:acyl-CoA synthetase (AMP-forming)/AMP-acid ligase II